MIYLISRYGWLIDATVVKMRSALVGIYHQDLIIKTRFSTLGVSSKYVARRTIYYGRAVYGEKLLIFTMLLKVFFFLPFFS